MVKDSTKVVKFATQVDEQVLAELRQLAHASGRKVQALVGDALATYLANSQQGMMRPEIMASLRQGQVDFGDVYKALVRQS